MKLPFLAKQQISDWLGELAGGAVTIVVIAFIFAAINAEIPGLPFFVIVFFLARLYARTVKIHAQICVGVDRLVAPEESLAHGENVIREKIMREMAP